MVAGAVRSLKIPLISAGNRHHLILQLDRGDIALAPLFRRPEPDPEPVSLGAAALDIDIAADIEDRRAHPLFLVDLGGEGAGVSLCDAAQIDRLPSCGRNTVPAASSSTTLASSISGSTASISCWVGTRGWSVVMPHSWVSGAMVI